MSESALEKTINRRPSSLTLEAGWKKKLDVANVVGLCGELHAGRILPPIKIDSESRVVAGRHRVAAHLLVKLLDKHVPGSYGEEKHDSECAAKIVRWVNGGNFDLTEVPVRCDVIDYADSDEAKIDELSENLRRRQISDEERAADLVVLVKLYEKKIAAEAKRLEAEAKAAAADAAAAKPGAKPAKVKGTPGRKKSNKRKAIEAAAKTAGTSTDTVERALERADETAKAGEVNATPVLDWFGLTPIGDVESAARRVKTIIAEADTKARMSGRLIVAAGEAGLPKSIVNEIDATFTAYMAKLDGATPSHACPSCKGVLRRACPACGGVGYATVEQMKADVPKDLLKRGDNAMVRDGQGGIRMFHEKSAEAAKKGSKKKATVTVRDDSGKETEVSLNDSGNVEPTHADDEAF